MGAFHGDCVAPSGSGRAYVARRNRPSSLDRLVQCANALLLLAVLWARDLVPHAEVFAGAHVMLATAVWWLGFRVDPDAASFDVLAFLRHWLPAIIIVLMYFELGVLIPLLRDFDDLRYDHALQAIDVWLLGDPVAVVERLASPALSDILMACYFAYYPLALVVPAALYVREAKPEFQRAAATILLGFMLSYVGYLAFPALGPHRVFDAHRPDALDGYGFSAVAYEWLLAVPHEPPDAFPSGHALIALLVPALAWRYARSLFYFALPIAVGIVFATLYLRLHYVADVAASIVLAPICYVLGRKITGQSTATVAQPERGAHRA